MYCFVSLAQLSFWVYLEQSLSFRKKYIVAFNMAAVWVVMVEFSGIKYSGYMGFRSN